MGTGESGNYYTSHGSKFVHHEALIHSIDGIFIHDPKTGRPTRMKSGGHDQANLDLMDKLGIKYNIIKIWPNGVRVGNIPEHKVPFKRQGENQAWFPTTWRATDIVKAGEYIVSLKRNANTPDGITMWGTFKGVRVGVKKTNGKIATIFPDSDQSTMHRRK